MDAPKPKPPTQKLVTVTQLGTNRKTRVPENEVKKTPMRNIPLEQNLAENPIVALGKEEIQAIVKKADADKPVEKKPMEDKRPFVLQPHLTERPLKHHEGLQQLRESISPKRGRK